MDHLQDM